VHADLAFPVSAVSLLAALGDRTAVLHQPLTKVVQSERYQYSLQSIVSPRYPHDELTKVIMIIQGRASYLNRGPPAASGMRILHMSFDAL
jgi:hypothetical protein